MPSNNGTPKCKIVGDFHTQLSLMERTNRRSTKEIEDLNTVNQLDLIDTYRTPTLTTTGYMSSHVHTEHSAG